MDKKKNATWRNFITYQFANWYEADIDTHIHDVYIACNDYDKEIFARLFTDITKEKNKLLATFYEMTGGELAFDENADEETRAKLICQYMFRYALLDLVDTDEMVQKIMSYYNINKDDWKKVKETRRNSNGEDAN